MVTWILGLFTGSNLVRTVIGIVIALTGTWILLYTSGLKSEIQKQKQNAQEYREKLAKCDANVILFEDIQSKNKKVLQDYKEENEKLHELMNDQERESSEQIQYLKETLLRLSETSEVPEVPEETLEVFEVLEEIKKGDRTFEIINSIGQH